MIKTFKELIKELSFSAVNIAEQSMETKTGQEKKLAAIEYVVSKLPIIAPFKKIVVIFLSKFIDEAIEQAVSYMKEVQND